MMKRFGRSFISLVLVAVLLVSSFTILTNAAEYLASYSFDLYPVCDEDVSLSFNTIINGTVIDDGGIYRLLDPATGLTALTDDDYQDEHGIYAIDGFVKMRKAGSGEGIMGVTENCGMKITNGSLSCDILCNFVMEDGVFNFDKCSGCTIDKEAALITIPAGSSATLDFTTPKSANNYLYFTLMNFRAVKSDSEYRIIIYNDSDAEGYLTVVNNADGNTEDIYCDYEEHYFSATYADGIDFSYTSEDEDYVCIGLFDEDNNFYSLDNTFYPTKSTSLFPLVVDQSIPIFMVENKVFTDLNEASDAAYDSAVKRVILIRDGVLESGDYYIPEGVTLLIPFDEANTLYTVQPGTIEDKQVSSRYPYRTLTMADGANITVEDGAAISVGAKHASTTTGSGKSYNGAVAGAYGRIHMEEGSSISLEGSSNLYAWGYITGDGEINAYDGSTVYEYFQINDWRGGTITSNMANPLLNQFPFNQYYVQNIEATLRVHYGAVENVFIEIYAGGRSVSFVCSFIDKGDADECMFRLKTPGSYLEKRYDYSTDKMKYQVKGNADIDAITLTLSGVTISSADYYLPISNIDVTLLNGSSLSTDKNIVFMPGSSVTVEDGAKVVITSGEYTYVSTSGASVTKTCIGSVILAAKDDIGLYSANGGTRTYPCKPVIYTPTAHPTRTWENTPETFLNNNGVITVNGSASLAATSEKAEIYSSTGYGTFVMNGTNATAAVLTNYQSGSGNEVVSDGVATVPALIQDEVGDASVEDSHSTSAVWGIPATFRKVNGKWGDYRDVSWIDIDGSEKMHIDDLAYDVFLTMEQPDHQEKPDDENGSYMFLGWVIDSVGETSVTVVPSYQLIREDCTITWLVDGKAPQTTTAPYNTVPAAIAKPSKTSDAQYTYDFIGWTSDGGVTVYAYGETLPVVLDDITYTAVFKENIRKYTINFELYDFKSGSSICKRTKKNVPYGTVYDTLYTDLYIDDEDSPNLVQKLKKWKEYTEDFAFVGWATGSSSNAAKNKAKVYNLTFNANQSIFVDGSVSYYTAAFVYPEGSFKNHSVSLNGNIGVNFYINIPEGNSIADYTVGYSFRGEYNEPVALADYYDEESSMYKYTVAADAPQMTDGVTAVLYKSGTPVDSDIYRVADYAYAVQKMADDEEMDDTHTAAEVKPLVRAMLNYGAMAQEYFAEQEYSDTVNSDSAANYIVDTSQVNNDPVTDTELENAAPAGSTPLNEGTTAAIGLDTYGLRYHGVSAVLDSQTALRLYFYIADEDKFNTYKNSITFGFNDNAVAPMEATENGKYVYIEYKGIAAADIAKNVTMKINGNVLIKYSVMDYLKKALDNENSMLNPNVKLIRLITAMYHYNLMAVDYFD